VAAFPEFDYAPKAGALVFPAGAFLYRDGGDSGIA
jgi:hypothetical protein